MSPVVDVDGNPSRTGAEVEIYGVIGWHGAVKAFLVNPDVGGLQPVIGYLLDEQVPEERRDVQGLFFKHIS